MDSSNGSAISNQAFQEALQRARQLAAKITQQAPGGSGSSNTSTTSSSGGMGSGLPGGKRPLEDMHSPDAKRMAAINDPIGAQLAAMKNQSAGGMGGGGGGGGGPGGPGFGARPAKNQRYPNGIVINGEKTLDMMVPGNKVGYVIGKGGEMIRNLQERAGVKMTVFQETNEATETEKQLRIIGAPDKVDYAQQLVNDLLTEKEIETVRLKSNSFNKSMTNEYGTQRYQNIEVPVPPQYIGLVIGKGGETIRRIQQEAGCKVQFDTTKLDPNGNKVCQISGNPDCVKRAHDMVNEIVENAMQGRGPPKNREGEEVRFGIPAHRTGAVIGRGGDTIKALKQQSGCDIELEKVTRNGDPDQKYFLIRGTPDKIEYAKQLIMDKVNGTNNAQPVSSYNDNQPNQWPQYWSQQQEMSTQHQSDESKGQDANYAAWAAYYAQYYAQAQQAASAPPTAPPTSTPSAPTNNSSNGGPDGSAPQTGDPSQGGAGNEYLYHQWIEYYRAYGMVKEAEMIEQMMKTGQKPGEDKSSDQSGVKPEPGNPPSVAYPGYNYSNYPSNSSQNNHQ